MSDADFVRDKCFRELDSLEKELEQKIENIKRVQANEMKSYQDQIDNKKKEIDRINSEIEKQKENHKQKKIELEKQHRDEVRRIEIATAQTVQENQKAIAAKEEEFEMVKEEQIIANRNAQKAKIDEMKCREANKEIMQVEPIWEELNSAILNVQQLVLEHEDDETKIKEALRTKRNDLTSPKLTRKDTIAKIKKVVRELNKVTIHHEEVKETQNLMNSICDLIQKLQLDFNAENPKSESFEELMEETYNITKLVTDLQDRMLNASTTVFGALGAGSSQRGAIQNGNGNSRMID